jgi:hypothetical protein
MAKVTKQYLGVVRGKLGPEVFKEMNGESYVASAPSKPAPSTNPKVIARRYSFGLVMKLGHAISSIPFLKYFWKSLVIPTHPKAKTACNKVVVINYHNASASGLSNTTALVPEKGFIATSTDITLSNTTVSVVLVPIGNSTIINPAVDKKIFLACVLHLSDPSDKYEVYNRLLYMISDGQTVNLVNPLSFSISLDDIDKQYFDLYATKKAFFALITTDADDVPLHYSNTFFSV